MLKVQNIKSWLKFNLLYLNLDHLEIAEKYITFQQMRRCDNWIKIETHKERLKADKEFQRKRLLFRRHHA